MRMVKSIRNFENSETSLREYLCEAAASKVLRHRDVEKRNHSNPGRG
jgi:hypothetical protein